MITHRLPAGRVVICLVQTQILWALVGGLRSLKHDGIESCLQQLGVVNIGWGDYDGQRTAISFDQKAAFYPVFRAISGVRPDLVPPKRALPITASAACHCQSTPPSSSHC